MHGQDSRTSVDLNPEVAVSCPPELMRMAETESSSRDEEEEFLTEYEPKTLSRTGSAVQLSSLRSVQSLFHSNVEIPPNEDVDTRGNLFSQLTALLPFILIAVEMVCGALVILELFRAKHIFERSDNYDDDDNTAVSKLSITRFHLAHNLARYISSVILIFVAYKDDRWRKNMPPFSILWGAESCRGIVTRCCLWATHFAFLAGYSGIVLDYSESQSFPMLGVMFLFIYFGFATFWIQRRVQDVQKRYKWHIFMKRSAVGFWMLFVLVMDLLLVLYSEIYSGPMKIAVTVLSLDLTRVAWEQVTNVWRRHHTIFFESEEVTFLNGMVPWSYNFIRLKAKDLSPCCDKFFVEFNGIHTATAIRRLVQFGTLLEQQDAIEVPRWMIALGSDPPASSHKKISVVFKISGLFDPEYIYEDRGRVFFHIDRGTDLVLEKDGRFTREGHVGRHRKSLVSQPILLQDLPIHAIDVTASPEPRNDVQHSASHDPVMSVESISSTITSSGVPGRASVYVGERNKVMHSLDQSHLVSSTSIFIRKQARTTLPFLMIAAELAFDIANTAWYRVQADRDYNGMDCSDFASFEVCLDARKAENSALRQAVQYYISRCSITLLLTGVGVFRGKWKKVGVSPLNADWGAETCRGFACRGVLAVVFWTLHGWGAVDPDYIERERLAISIPCVTFLFLFLGFLLLLAMFLVRLFEKDIRTVRERFVFLNQVLAFCWEIHCASMDLFHSLIFENGLSSVFSALLFVLDIGRVLYDFVTDFKSWNISYFDGIILMKSAAPSSIALSFYKSEPITESNEVIVQFGGMRSADVIKDLLRHASLIQKSRKVSMPGWAESLGYNPNQEEEGVPVVMSIRRLLDGEFIYELPNGSIVFYVAMHGMDLILLEDGTCTTAPHVHVPPAGRLPVTRPFLLK